MIEIIPFEDSQISLIEKNINRSQLQYHEYLFINDVQLKNYFSNRLINAIKNPESFSFAAMLEGKILGLIICSKDSFDSEIFGFNCYRIAEMLVFSEKHQEINTIVYMLTTTLEKKLTSISSPVYISLSLNNNTNNGIQLFNSFVANNYYYIQTLLTFGSQNKKFESSLYYPKENLNIRFANENDAPQVAVIAEKSFRYNRLHLDPFLDKDKVSFLYKKSAENSILHGFVDVVFVAEINEKIVGYYSAKKKYIQEFEKTIGDVVVSAIDSNYRGLGIFSKLDAHILNWFSEKTDFAEMGTYLINYPVHKAWIRKNLSLIRGTHQFSKFIK